MKRFIGIKAKEPNGHFTLHFIVSWKYFASGAARPTTAQSENSDEAAYVSLSHEAHAGDLKAFIQTSPYM